LLGAKRPVQQQDLALTVGAFEIFRRGDGDQFGRDVATQGLGAGEHLEIGRTNGQGGAFIDVVQAVK
jgi:hypothetical protein